MKVVFTLLISICFSFNLRVLVYKNENIKVFCDGEFEVSVYQDDLFKRVLKRSFNESLEFSATYFPYKNLLITPLTGFIWVNNNCYRGEIELVLQNGLLYAINLIEIEDYLKGVVGLEISKNWHIEALKAQAVIARTFAIAAIKRHKFYDLCSTVHCQVYGGIKAESKQVEEAVKLTEGEILTYNATVIFTAYHACCGGETLSSLEAWGKYQPYLESVKCFCSQSPYARDWEFSISYRELEEALRIRMITDIRKISSNKISINANGKNHLITVGSLRESLGYFNVRSNRFDLINLGTSVKFKGRGFGHGVGLCQWGMKYLAENNWDYKKILEYYFKGVKIEKILIK